MRNHLFTQVDQLYVLLTHQIILYILALFINIIVFLVLTILYRRGKNSSVRNILKLALFPLLISLTVPIVFGIAVFSHFHLGGIFPAYYDGYGFFKQVPLKNNYYIYFSDAESGEEYTLARLRKNSTDINFLFDQVISDDNLIFLISRDDDAVLEVNIDNGIKTIYNKDILKTLDKEPKNIFKFHGNYWLIDNAVYNLLGVIYLSILILTIIFGIIILRHFIRKGLGIEANRVE